MWVVALEALVALSLLLLIVWLTMGGSRRRDGSADESKKIGHDDKADPHA